MLTTALVLTLWTLVRAEFDPDIHRMYELLPEDQFVTYFNSLNLSYTIATYDHPLYVSKVLKMDPDALGPKVSHKVPGLPKNFDARENWPNCVTMQEIYDQGSCGSCWTFGTATALSDRYCVYKNLTVRLSEEDYECGFKHVCGGNDPAAALNYWISNGLVTQECKPYNISELSKNTCVKKCTNGKDYDADKHRGTAMWAVASDDESIKSELFKNGSISVGMAVYGDFFKYKTGVYVHTYGKLAGYHSIRVIGYGVENGLNYWLAANSWSSTWGENGYFKIETQQKLIQFEDYVYAGLP